MSTNCTRCQGTGFLNIEQAPDPNAGHEAILDWIDEMAAKAIRMDGCTCHIYPPCSYCFETQHDVQVCDCCGNGVDAWHGEPGQHYTAADPQGKNGPYSYNGGLCECH